MIGGFAWKGIKDFDKAVDAMVERASRVARESVVEGGHLIESWYKRLYRPRQTGSQRRSATGRIWYDYRPPFQAQPPYATQRSGNDRNSVRVEVRALGAAAWESKTGPTMIYSRALNLGNDNAFGRGITTRAFPMLEMALDASIPELRRMYAERWRAAVAV